MISKISKSELMRAKQLEDLGIPLDREVMEKSEVATPKLWIDQDFAIIQTRIFDVRSGGTGVFITLDIRNGSDLAVRLDNVRLDIPWCNHIRWLKESFHSVTHQYYYSFPEADPQRYDHDVVLNHHFGRKELLPGDHLDGMLLGMADEPMPDCYVDRQCFEARLWVTDGRRNQYPVDVKFFVQRDQHRHRQQAAAEGLVTPTRPVSRRNITSSPVEAKTSKTKKVA